MKLIETPIRGVWLIEHEVHKDERGEVFESFNHEEYGKRFLNSDWQRTLYVRNPVKGTLRGLHYAPYFREFKLVRCVRGRIFDVTVDLRKDSPTYGMMYYVELRSPLHQSLYIPPGVAHGYQTVAHHSDVEYLLSSPCHCEQEGINPFDPQLKIPWPIKKPLMNKRDRNWPLLLLKANAA